MLCRAYENGLGDHMAIKGHDGSNCDLLSLNNGHISRTVMCLEKSGHLGAVLCIDFENVLGDNMVIKGHDSPNSDLFTLNYILTFPNSVVIVVVWSLAKSISTLCHVDTMKMVFVTIWPSRAMMVQIVIFFL